MKKITAPENHNANRCPSAGGLRMNLKLDPRRSAVLASATAQVLIAAAAFVLIIVHGPRPVYFLFIALSGTITATLLCRVHGPLSRSRWLRGLAAVLWVATLIILWEVMVKA